VLAQAVGTVLNSQLRNRRRLVVGVDGTSAGWQALAWAADEAAATGACLTVCRTGLMPPGGLTMEAIELADPEFACFLHRVRDRLGGQRVGLRFDLGHPADVLHAAAARDADLLVVGADAPAGRGACAARVASDAGVPVVVVRPTGRRPHGPFAGHVVVAVAGADVDPLALDFGFRYAAAHRLPVAAVHVGTYVAGDFWFDERTLETRFVDEPPALTVVTSVVEPFLPRFPGVPVKLVVLTGQPVQRLVDAARGARLTVMGRRRRRLAARLLGSVSRAVLTTADGPVAVVPIAPSHR